MITDHTFVRRLIVPAAGALAVAAVLYTTVLRAQQPTAPTYTADQAQRGEHVVSGHCVECHGDLLQGTEAPALKGEPFMRWLTGRSIGAAFTKIRETMPVDAEDTVTDDEKLDALAYLLQVNGVPEGDSELPADVEALNNMRVPPRSGGALQSGAAVEATGCLQKGSGNEWLLTGSTGAVAAVTAGALGATPPTAAPAGAPRTLRVLNVFPTPTAHVSHTVKVAGLLVLDAEGQAINATSLTMVSDSCAK